MDNINQKPFDEYNKAHGEWLIYYNYNGKLAYRWNYFHGIKHGLQRGYHVDGALWFRGYYNMGRKVGYWLWYNEKRYYLCII